MFVRVMDVLGELLGVRIVFWLIWVVLIWFVLIKDLRLFIVVSDEFVIELLICRKLLFIVVVLL